MSNRSAWSPRNIYLYLVCLITLVMAIVATVNLVRALAEVVYPEPESYTTVVRVASPDGEGGELDEKELAESNDLQRRWALRRSVLSLVGSVTMLLVAGPLYVYHWRKIEKRTVADAAVPTSE